jgi:phage tail-like protein
MDNPYNQPPAFYFRVLFDGDISNDTSFMEVRGIESELSTETYTELNENRFEYKLPTKAKNKNLVLKRGIAKNTSPLVKWCKKVLEDYQIPITTKTIQVSLLNANAQPIRMWVFNNAYPVKWSVGDFESKKNDLAIETIEFAYTYSQRFI